MTITPNVHQRLHACMGDVDYIQKERKSGMSYTIVSHDAVTAKVRPILHKHGIVYYPVEMQASQEGERTQVQLKVRFANIDDPADFIDVCGLGYGVDKTDKGPGKATSYAVKYCLLKALGLETGDDPDLDDQPAKTHEIGHGRNGTLLKPRPEPSAPSGSAGTTLASGRQPFSAGRGSLAATPEAEGPANDWLILAQDIERDVKTKRSNAEIDHAMAHYAKALASMKIHDPDRYNALGAMVKGCRTALAPVAG